jgi:predicted RND superfamily exporter protein
LRVYARGNIWNMDKLAAFVRDVESVDPLVTGHPVQTYYASRQLQQSYVHAALYALVVVGIVVMLDFRGVRYTLLSLVPMIIGLLLLFGILGYLDIPLNPANMIALPLILGMGLDDGVHLVHCYRQQQGRFRLTSSTATALLLTSLTTMVGFGMLVFARHQGIRTLGQALTIGMFTCLATSIITLPALLALLSWNRRETTQPETATTTLVEAQGPEQAHEDEDAEPEPFEHSVAAPTASTLRASRILARRRRRPSARI